MSAGAGDGLVVAIDGPAGSGKSTAARQVADALGLEVLDTGAMYRAVTHAVLEAGVDPGDADRVAAVAGRIDLETGERVLVDGRDVSAAIRGPEVTAAVSAVSAHAAVRTLLVAGQRAWVDERGGGVVEGRDIGTVVFPDAPVKIYLDAVAEVRAGRRQSDEVAAQRAVDVADVAADLARRDRLDSTRAAAPLHAAPDAVVIDTTELSVEEVVGRILEAVEDAGVAR